MTPEQQAQLRAPFPPESVGKLPRVTCRACADAPGRVCGAHKKSRCGECGNYISTEHTHIDYVGHAAVTDRLLAVDPEWTWRPMTDAAERAAVEAKPGELWAWITIAGVERACVGTAARPGDLDAAKMRISDMIVNGAMRSGVGLDLWSKEDLHAGDDQEKKGPSPVEKKADPATVPYVDEEPPLPDYIPADVPLGDVPFSDAPQGTQEALRAAQEAQGSSQADLAVQTAQEGRQRGTVTDKQLGMILRMLRKAAEQGMDTAAVSNQLILDHNIFPSYHPDSNQVEWRSTFLTVDKATASAIIDRLVNLVGA